jgi:uncharacterized protein YjbJ (UPF0337 family)
MPESAKDLKGQAKEKVGDVAGDDDLKHEGQFEQAGEKVKGAVDKGVDAAKGLLDKDK